MIDREAQHIKSWILNVIKDESWKNYNDLHIDDIDLKCEKSSTWISCSIKYLKKAIEIRNSLNLCFVVALGIELKSSQQNREIRFNNVNKLNSELGNSPPSLYLFLPTWTNWTETLERSVEIKNNLFEIENTKCYYYEYFHIDDMEYRRSIFLWSPPTKN